MVIFLKIQNMKRLRMSKLLLKEEFLNLKIRLKDQKLFQTVRKAEKQYLLAARLLLSL